MSVFWREYEVEILLWLFSLELYALFMVGLKGEVSRDPIFHFPDVCFCDDLQCIAASGIRIDAYRVRDAITIRFLLGLRTKIKDCDMATTWHVLGVYLCG